METDVTQVLLSILNTHNKHQLSNDSSIFKVFNIIKVFQRNGENQHLGCVLKLYLFNYIKRQYVNIDDINIYTNDNREYFSYKNNEISILVSTHKILQREESHTKHELLTFDVILRLNENTLSLDENKLINSITEEIERRYKNRDFRIINSLDAISNMKPSHLMNLVDV